MDQERFDQLARALGGVKSRRAAVRVAIGSLLGGVGVGAGAEALADKKRKKGQAANQDGSSEKVHAAKNRGKRKGSKRRGNAGAAADVGQFCNENNETKFNWCHCPPGQGGNICNYLCLPQSGIVSGHTGGEHIYDCLCGTTGCSCTDGPGNTSPCCKSINGTCEVNAQCCNGLQCTGSRPVQGRQCTSSVCCNPGEVCFNDGTTQSCCKPATDSTCTPSDCGKAIDDGCGGTINCPPCCNPTCPSTAKCGDENPCKTGYCSGSCDTIGTICVEGNDGTHSCQCDKTECSADNPGELTDCCGSPGVCTVLGTNANCAGCNDVCTDSKTCKSVTGGTYSCQCKDGCPDGQVQNPSDCSCVCNPDTHKPCNGTCIPKVQCCGECASTGPCVVQQCVDGECQTTYPGSETICEGWTFCAPKVCNGVGGCVTGTPPNCNDGNPCTIDTCSDELKECVNTPISGCVTCETETTCPQPTEQCRVATCNGNVCGIANSQPGAECNDGDACTTNDVCQADGSCAGTLIPDCVPCTPTGNECASIPVATCEQAVCNTELGYCETSVSPSGTPCEDGNLCTTGDTCNGEGTCVAGAAVVCPGITCQIGTCQPGTGTCTYVADPNCAGCTPNCIDQVCGESDGCGGVCTACPDGQTCIGTGPAGPDYTCCAPAQVCGTTCCPTGETCIDGVCSGTPAQICIEQPQTCDPASGLPCCGVDGQGVGTCSFGHCCADPDDIYDSTTGTCGNCVSLGGSCLSVECCGTEEGTVTCLDGICTSVAPAPGNCAHAGDRPQEGQRCCDRLHLEKGRCVINRWDHCDPRNRGKSSFCERGTRCIGGRLSPHGTHVCVPKNKRRGRGGESLIADLETGTTPAE